MRNSTNTIRSQISHRQQRYGEREMFLPQIAWKRNLFLALCDGDVATVEKTIKEHPMSINQRIFDMGFQIGLGSAMRFLDCSAPLHVAAWNGHAALVRWLLNHGAEPTARDGLNQTPIEIAGSHEVKRILGAARGVIDLNDKVELIGYDAAQSINDVGAKLRLQLERMGGRMGEIEQDIENAAQRHAQAEVMELRAALGRKIDKELHTFYKQIKKEMKMTKLKNDLKEALERLEEIEFKQEAHLENVDTLQDFQEEHKTELMALKNKLEDIQFDTVDVGIKSRRGRGESDDSAEVESSSGKQPAGHREILRAMKKVQSKHKAHVQNYEATKDDVTHLQKELAELKKQVARKKSCTIQ